MSTGLNAVLHPRTSSAACLPAWPARRGPSAPAVAARRGSARHLVTPSRTKGCTLCMTRTYQPLRYGIDAQGHDALGHTERRAAARLPGDPRAVDQPLAVPVMAQWTASGAAYFTSLRLGEHLQLRISRIACACGYALAWAVTERRIRGAAARVRPEPGPRVPPAGLRPQRCGCLTWRCPG
jgi:hypothetical protein